MSHSRSTGTNLGIKTPLLHNTSNPPNGCDPSMYCNGFALARSRHVRWRCCGHVVYILPEDVRVTLRLVMACSRSQRSSLSARRSSRQGRRRRGRRGWRARARWMSGWERRGIHYYYCSKKTEICPEHRTTFTEVVSVAPPPTRYE